jgi:peptidoglycan/LPS O-acetylase OafA/YrhL
MAALMTTTATGSPRRLGLLDVLRLLAALSVVAFHYVARNSPGWGGAPPEELGVVGSWAIYGRLGVPLFFVISGFVVLMTAWGRTVPDFVASRIGRLFPAYWVAVVLSAVLVLVVWPEKSAFSGHEISKGGALLNLTMLQGAFGVPDLDGPYWTLWNEARFYLLIALFILVGITRRRVLAFAALWPVVGAVVAQGGPGALTTLLMPEYAPFFAGGMLLYVLYRDGHDLGVWLLVGLQVAIALNWAPGAYTYMLAGESPWSPSTAAIAAVTVACFGLVALVTLTRLNAVSAGWMVVAGALTYPVYLVHENLGWFVIHLVRDSVSPWVAVGLATVTALVAAALLHHLVEKPFGGRLRRAVLRMTEDGATAGPAGSVRLPRARAGSPRTPSLGPGHGAGETGTVRDDAATSRLVAH